MNRPTLLAALLALATLAACGKDTVCPAGETACGGRCVSLLSDEANCGACGTTCDALAVCSAGACACAPGATACGATCADLASDTAHCGACGNACGGGEVCNGGACAPTCGSGLTACDRACVDLAADRSHCGACGIACAAGQTCRAGACSADLQVACFATNEVRPVTADLAPAGPARAAGQGPISLALDSTRIFAANTLSHSLSVLPLDARLAGVEVPMAGDDFEHVAVDRSLVFISNSGVGTEIVYDPGAGRVLDEIVLGATADVNPRGIAFTGTRAFVPLYGRNESTGGQAIAAVDLSGLATCGQPDPAPPACGAGGACPDGRACRAGVCTRTCGTLEKTLTLRDVAAAYDAPGLPFPSRALAVSGKVYVTLANLKKATSGPSAGFYVDPAGPGRLAVVDTAAGDALSIVSLGDGCKNPGALALEGRTLWISCAWAGGPALLPVDLSGSAPVPGTPLAVPVGAPGNLAFCGGMGYLTDLWSGNVARFDPAGTAPPLVVGVCPLSDPGPYGWAWAADVACAP